MTRANSPRRERTMKFIYDTETDSISSPDLSDEQVAAMQAQLSSALYRNDPVQTVAHMLLDASKK
jgi:hypothetical protein